MITRHHRLTSATFALALSIAAVVHAQTAATPGDARLYSTVYSIGVEWNIGGDTNHNAAATVGYRVQGSTSWTGALPLVRVDYGANMLAGSILFLTPNTTYELALSITDPDGGAERRVLIGSTRPLPSLPSGGRTFHVIPGGGGAGTTADPFRSIDAAQAIARPGDTFLLHAGDYGGRIALSAAGAPSSHLLWTAYGDGEVLLRGVDIAGSHVWLEGITIRNQPYALMAASNPDDVVVRRCRFLNNHYGIYMQEGGRNWYIADNTIVGDAPYGTGSFDGEGIDLNITGGHTVAHNSITNVADGISSPSANVDIFGNDIFDTSDDGIELDYGGANVRVWGNRIHNAVHNGISFQPQALGPWYILRNQIVGNVEGAFKFRTTDRFVLLHNTIVNWGTAWPGDAMMCCNEEQLLRAIARNNLWISVQGGQIWGFDAGVVDWRTDLDYDGFDWGASATPFAYGGQTYPDTSTLAFASGLEAHGRRVSKEACFATFDVPNPPPAPVPPQMMTLRSSCAAVDAGTVLPNVNAGSFAGAAPDLGAYEYGQPDPQFGPRIGPTVRLVLLPSTIAAGESTTLSWTTTDASTVAIDGIGLVSGSGSATVSPSSSTIYTLTATGRDGVATATATVTVGAAPPVGGSTPYSGTPVALPGAIEAENFDNGGEMVAYHDTTSGNRGGVYRNTDVDLEVTSDAGGGYDVAKVRAGEWLTYTVRVATAGAYAIDVRVASLGAGGTFHVEANGLNITGPLAVPDTGGGQTWATITRADVPLTAGTQLLRLVMDSDGAGGGVANFNWIRVRQDQPAPGWFAITAPSPGMTLRTTSVVVEWAGTGDEFSVNVGTAPGTADVYASGPLGSATTRHTVNPLPLNGCQLYVEVRRRIGGATERAYAQYTAPIRKALAIITDFSDRSLEDWTIDGMRSVDEVAANLRKLEDHWAWLSHGLERFHWDIIRIRLTQAAVPGAFSGWGAFRDAVATLAKQQVDTSDYDVNGDGVLDVSWAIVSAAGDVAEGIKNFALGGASRNAGVNMFVDGQASTSVTSGATANFTHEIGHLLGIPDLYGQYGTLTSVSIMSFSWPLPPGDFTAYERLTPGWLKPNVVTRTTTGLWLPRATDQIAAVKVPTSRPEEYFLIEYRHRPESGYGSADVDYDGLIVYHVLEGSSMSQDPPIVRVEPADGSITPSSITDPDDFLYPGNPGWTRPLVLYSYYGNAPEVFRIDNVALVNGGMTFDITVAPVQGSSNLLTNGSFESGQAGHPDGWAGWTWVGAPEGFLWPSPTASTGAYSAGLQSSFANDKAWTQTVSMVAGDSYVLCGSLKGLEISGPATVSVLGSSIQSAGLYGSFDWTRSCVTFKSDRPVADVGCRIGSSFSLASGTLWCDDMTLDHLRRVF